VSKPARETQESASSLEVGVKKKKGRKKKEADVFLWVHASPPGEEEVSDGAL